MNTNELYQKLGLRGFNGQGMKEAVEFLLNLIEQIENQEPTIEE